MHITYILANIDKAMAFEWIAERLDQTHATLSFILLNPGDSHLATYLEGRGLAVRRVRFRGKRDMPRAILQVWATLREWRTDVVHAQLLYGGLVGLSAARLAGVRHRLYTRHHATFHWRYHPRGVLYDRYNNRLATRIIAISENVRTVLVEREQVPPGKIELIHHGFDLGAFRDVPADRVAALRAKYDVQPGRFVVGVISRYLELKGITYAVQAFRQYLAQDPGACLVLANARGPDRALIQAALASLPPDSYREIPFEQDLFALYRLFDIFLQIPVDPEIEAFGQTYVEALAAGVPSVFTLSGVASEFIRDGENALVVGFRDSDAILAAIRRLAADPALGRRLADQGRLAAARFDIDVMIRKLNALYRGLGGAAAEEPKP